MKALGNTNLRRLCNFLLYHQLLYFTQANRDRHRHTHRDRAQQYQLAGNSNLSPYNTKEPYASTATSKSLAMSFILGNATDSYHPISNEELAYPGRVGYISIYLPSFILSASDTGPAILYIGGQIDSTGTYITNDVMMFRPMKPYQSPASQVPNPQLLPFLSNGLPPTAWGSGGIDHQGKLWVIGGVVEDCHHTALAYVRDLKEGSLANWTSWHHHGTNSTTKRRRQTRAVRVIRNSTSYHPQHSPLTSKDSRVTTSSLISNQSTTHGHAEFWILGGVSDPYTCSKTLLGHLGVDKWDTQKSTVDPLQLDCVRGNQSTCLRPPIADYSVTSLSHDAQKIIYIGGQLVDGSFGKMDVLFVLDTLHEKLEYVSAAGVTPSPRRAHASIMIPSFGVTLVHGGLSPTQNVTSDAQILNTTSIPWKWTQLKVTKESHPPPNRAFHSMHLVSSNVILISLGIQSENYLVEGEEAFFILRLERDPDSHDLLGTWSTTNDTRNFNPYTPTYGNSQPTPTNFQPIPPYDSGGDQGNGTTPYVNHQHHGKPNLGPPTNPLPVPPAIQTTTTQDSDNSPSKDVSQHQKAIVGAVSAVCGSFILILCALLLVRSRQRKPAQKRGSINSFNRNQLYTSETLNSTINPDFLTPMAYVQVTRPCATRAMTLGSSSTGFHERDHYPINRTPSSFGSDHTSRLSSFSIQEEPSERSFLPASPHRSIDSPNTETPLRPSGLHRRRNSRVNKSFSLSEAPSPHSDSWNGSRPPSQTSFPSNVYIASNRISANLQRSTPEFDKSSGVQSTSACGIPSTPGYLVSKASHSPRQSLHSQISARSYPYLMPIYSDRIPSSNDSGTRETTPKPNPRNSQINSRTTTQNEITERIEEDQYRSILSNSTINPQTDLKSAWSISSKNSEHPSSENSNHNWLERIRPKFDSWIFATTSAIRRSMIIENENNVSEDRGKNNDEDLTKIQQVDVAHHSDTLIEETSNYFSPSIISNRVLRIANGSIHSSPAL